MPAAERPDARLHVPERFAIDPHIAIIWQVAGYRLQKGGLARSVGPDNGRHSARLHRQRHIAENEPAPDPHRKIIDIDRHHRSRIPLWRSNIHRKNGAPSVAVTMPIGSSAGATTTRLIASATRSRLAPRSAEAGSR